MGDNPAIDIGEPDGNGNVQTVLTPKGVELLRDGKAGLSTDIPAMQKVAGDFGKWATQLAEYVTDDTYRIRDIKVKVYQGPDFNDGGEAMLVFKCRNVPAELTDAINNGYLLLDTMHAVNNGKDRMTVAVNPGR